MATPEICPNCRTVLPSRAEYCPACGQRQKDLRRGLRFILWDFVESSLNLNSRLWHTLAVMFWQPGQLSLDYAAGKRARYLSPVRLFLFLSALYVGSYLARGTVRVNFALHGGPERVKALLLIDSLQSQLENQLDRLKSDKSRPCAALADSLKHSITQVLAPYDREADSLKADTLVFNLDDNGPLRIPVKDVILYSGDELLEKHEIRIWWKKLLLRQFLRLLHGLDEFIKDFFQSKSWWLVLLMIPLLSLTLALVFWSKRRYYVEHLILSLEINNYISLMGLPLNFLPERMAGAYMLVLLAWSVVYLNKVLRRFYGLSRGAGILYSVIIALLSLPALLVSMFVVLLVSLLLF